MGHSCGYILGTSFSEICNFSLEFKTKSFRGRISIICRSSVAAIYQNKPLSPVSFFNCRNGLLLLSLFSLPGFLLFSIFLLCWPDIKFETAASIYVYNAKSYGLYFVVIHLVVNICMSIC